MGEQDHLSLGSVAKRCNVSRTTVYRWIISGQLKAYSLPSGHFRVIPEDLEAFCVSFGITQNGADGSGSRRAVPNKVNVLVADDHPDALLLFKRVVERYLPDAAIHEAVNGVDTCIAVGTLRPQVLILDIMMPGMDGFAVLQELLHRPELTLSRVIVVSAYEPFTRIEELARLNPQIVACLRKPLRVEDMGRILSGMAELQVPSGGIPAAEAR
jgi:excisionase family DNA binding protein